MAQAFIRLNRLMTVGAISRLYSFTLSGGQKG